MKKVLKNPSAWLPIVMSFSALAMIIGYLSIFGNVHHEDEGTTAHIFQFLMGGQLPIIAFFAIKYLPRKPKQAAFIIVMQFFAALLAFAPVYILGL